MTVDKSIGDVLSTALSMPVFAQTAQQRPAAGPYCVFTRISGPPINTMEGDLSPTRRWRYEIAIISDDRDQNLVDLERALAALVAHTDKPSPGIQRILPLDRGYDRWDEEQRLNRMCADVDIMENLTS